MSKLKTLGTLALAGALAAAVAACAGPAMVAPGSSAAQLRTSAGAPSEERTLPNGVKALYYVNGPSGWTTYRVLVDSSDRVISDQQVLTDRNFRDQLTVNKTSRSEVLDSLGKPAYVSRFPNLAEEVWTYRYLDGTLEMVNDVHIDAASGIVRSYSLYRDPAYSVNLAWNR
jgi:hypothetical protein